MSGSFLPSLWSSTTHSLLGSREPTLLCNHSHFAATRLRWILTKMANITKIAQQRRGAMVSPQSSKGRVLIIEDEVPLLESYSHSLAASGFDVVEASGASEGLERLKSSNFDVILTDILMPGIEGLDVVEQMRSQFPDIPVIAMFGKVDNRVAIKATELGVVQYLIKPIAAQALETTARRAAQMKG